MGHGGKRPGAGRPKGVGAEVREKALRGAEEAIAAGWTWRRYCLAFDAYRIFSAEERAALRPRFPADSRFAPREGRPGPDGITSDEPEEVPEPHGGDHPRAGRPKRSGRKTAADVCREAEAALAAGVPWRRFARASSPGRYLAGAELDALRARFPVAKGGRKWVPRAGRPAEGPSSASPGDDLSRS